MNERSDSNPRCAALRGIGIFAAGKNAGANKDVVVSGAFLTGAERNNYALANPSGTKAVCARVQR